MKVQIFPKSYFLDTPPYLFFTHIGALTLKPSAYQTRPWELTRVSVFNHFTGEGTLTLHTRGGKLFKVTQPTGWIEDRVRFFYDGLRRQRLVYPTQGGYPTGWSTAVVSLVGGAPRGWTTRVDPGGVYFFWFLRGSSFLWDSRLPSESLAVDCNYRGTYLGAFGLSAVATAPLGLPIWTPYEEETSLTPPTGGVSLWGWGSLVGQLFFAGSHSYGWSTLVAPVEQTPRENQHALFQVSPLQQLLGVW